MNMLKFNKAFGRLGNTMICVLNGIKFCEERGIKTLNFDIADIPSIFKWKKEGIMDTEITIETQNAPDNRPCPGLQIVDGEWEGWLLGMYHELDMEIRRRMCQQYIVPLLKLPKINLSLGENDLVIHVRGGDIFARPHHAYIQPPTFFYKEIVDSKNWNRIIVISEDKTNHLTKSVLALSDKMEFLGDMSGSPRRHGGNLWGFGYDFAVLLSAHNLVLSYSSMSPLLLQLSTNLQKAYIASFYLHMTRTKERPNQVREPRIWWGRELDSSNNFKVGSCEVHVLDYDDYANYPELYNYKDPKVVERLLNYKNIRP